MPQKKNPDAAELLRAKAPRVVGRLVGLHGVLHGLPLTYNKDLQEDKEALFDAIDTLELCLPAAAAMLGGTSFRRERMAAAAADEMLAATDVADLLVRRGVPFREAHGDRRRAGAGGGRERAAAFGPAATRSCASSRPSSTAGFRDLLENGRGWSRSSPRAARRSTACASSWRRPARCSREASR